MIWRWALLVGWFAVAMASCGQVTATDVNGLVTRGPAVDAGSSGGEPDPDKTAPSADTRGGDGATPDDAASTTEAPPPAPDACPAPCSRCAEPLATLRVVECRPGCATCSDKSGQIPVDACWADGWLQCVHSCDQCGR